MMTNLLLDITSATIDWSRAQFALTAIYHWLFVPLTLGLAVIMGIAETCYYRTNKPFWKHVTRFWQKLFGVNFAMGVATGIILEFEFGTNWSNYSWFVGDVFGAPLAIEGILAFFMESTFVAVMFFGWDKVSRGFHLASTWLTVEAHGDLDIDEHHTMEDVAIVLGEAIDRARLLPPALSLPLP